MKFVYEYRTSDNVRHEGEIAASDRDAAFRVLRERGIRPGRLKVAPGFVNLILGQGKRWVATAILIIAVVVSGIATARFRSKLKEATESSRYTDSEGYARPIARRQVWGDSAVISAAARQNWRVLFANPADRLLALFAEPGRKLSMLPRLPESLSTDMARALKERFKISKDELDEYRQMKCIVEGMKEELRAYLAAGGSLNGYIKRLQQRQSEEADYLEKARMELAQEVATGTDAFAAWHEMNRKIREQGLPALPMPGVP